MASIVNRIFEAGIRLLTVVLGLPILWLIEPFWRFRFARSFEDRIGHLAADFEVYARDMKSTGMPPRTTHIFLAWRPANRQLLTMWKRHIFIVENYLLRKAFEAAYLILKRTRFLLVPPLHFENHEVLSQGTPTLSFTEQEEQKGRRELEKMGLGPDDWWVCFHARDPLYLNARSTAGKAEYRANIRDCSIQNYIEAMEWVAAQGGYAIRLGAISEEVLPENLGPNIIDYANTFRTDFMDIYLTAKCRFFCGNTSGPFAVSAIFGRPAAVANSIPLWNHLVGMKTLFLPKLIERIDEGRVLNFHECEALNLFVETPSFRKVTGTSEFYEERGLCLLDNSPEDIVDLCRDMMLLTEADQEAAPMMASQLQLNYLNFLNHPTACYIGPTFITKYGNLMDSPSE